MAQHLLSSPKDTPIDCRSDRPATRHTWRHCELAHLFVALLRYTWFRPYVKVGCHDRSVTVRSSSSSVPEPAILDEAAVANQSSIFKEGSGPQWSVRSAREGLFQPRLPQSGALSFCQVETTFVRNYALKTGTSLSICDLGFACTLRSSNCPTPAAELPRVLAERSSCTHTPRFPLAELKLRCIVAQSHRRALWAGGEQRTCRHSAC